MSLRMPHPGPGTLLLVAALGSSAAGQTATETAPDKPADRVVKSEAEWRRILTPSQYWILRQKGTEPAFSGKYDQGHFQGTFVCVGCGAELFSARQKFESGTGWPSFWQPIRPQAVETATDTSLPSEVRVEVMCARCGAHLGHVFQDGPPPTGLRYCINSVALDLKSDSATGKGASTRTRSGVRPAVRSRTTSTRGHETPAEPAPPSTPETP